LKVYGWNIRRLTLEGKPKSHYVRNFLAQTVGSTGEKDEPELTPGLLLAWQKCYEIQAEKNGVLRVWGKEDKIGYDPLPGRIVRSKCEKGKITIQEGLEKVLKSGSARKRYSACSADEPAGKSRGGVRRYREKVLTGLATTLRGTAKTFQGKGGFECAASSRSTDWRGKKG